MFEEYGFIPDPRTDDIFLVSSPIPTLVLVAAYFIVVKIIGPIYMKNKKPYTLKNVLLAYNLLQVVLSTYIFYLSINSGWLTKYSFFKCQDVNYSATDKEAITGLYAVYFYFLSKFTEFMDTIFFVLRKKDNQISFLHLYHHSQMPIFSWIAARHFAGGSTTLATGLNSFVHIVMYAYYLLAALGPNVQKYLWWKKYLTTLQLIQFCVGMVHLSFFLSGECTSYSGWYLAIGGLYVITLIILFRNFYKESYDKKNKKESRNGSMKNGSASLEYKTTNNSLNMKNGYYKEEECRKIK